jgi:glycosyltransferase involved in cell wall biosynthesis
LALITPLYNGARFIRETLASCVAQIGPEDEVIVVDDGSSDGGAAIAAGTSPRVRVISQANQGEAAAVNAGVAASTAPVIAVINADDPILPGLLPAMRSAFTQDQELSGAYPDWVRIDADGKELARHVTRDFSYAVLLGEHLCQPGPGAFFRRAHLKGEIPRDARAFGITDFDFWLRFGLRNRAIRRVPGFLATWRSHRAGTTFRIQGARMAASRIAMIERLYARSDLPADVIALKRQAMSAAHYNAALIGLRARDVFGLGHIVASYAWKLRWPDSVGVGQRRHWPHMAYIAAQPLSSLAHAAMDPLLPPRFRRAQVLDQTFGID